MRLRESSLRCLYGVLPLLAGASISFGAAAGKPNLSGNLTKVSQPTKNQKLLADPEGAIEGSTSIVYDTSVATLTQVLAEPEANPISSRMGNGYYIDEIVVDGFNQQGQADNKIISLAGTNGLSWTNTSQLPFRQSGFVQVFWADLAPGTDPIGYAAGHSGDPAYYNPLPNLNDNEGESSTYANAIADLPNTAVGGNAYGDNNTYAAFFGPVSSNFNAFAQYMVYADAGIHFTIPDEYTVLLDDGSTMKYIPGGNNPIVPAVVGASFAPEPSSLAMIGVGAAMMLRRRRSSIG